MRAFPIFQAPVEPSSSPQTPPKCNQSIHTCNNTNKKTNKKNPTEKPNRKKPTEKNQQKKTPPSYFLSKNPFTTPPTLLNPILTLPTLLLSLSSASTSSEILLLPTGGALAGLATPPEIIITGFENSAVSLVTTRGSTGAANAGYVAMMGRSSSSLPPPSSL